MPLDTVGGGEERSRRLITGTLHAGRQQSLIIKQAMPLVSDSNTNITMYKCLMSSIHYLICIDIHSSTFDTLFLTPINKYLHFNLSFFFIILDIIFYVS